MVSLKVRGSPRAKVEPDDRDEQFNCTVKLTVYYYEHLFIHTLIYTYTYIYIYVYVNICIYIGYKQ